MTPKVRLPKTQKEAQTEERRPNAGSPEGVHALKINPSREKYTGFSTACTPPAGLFHAWEANARTHWAHGLKYVSQDFLFNASGCCWLILRCTLRGNAGEYGPSGAAHPEQRPHLLRTARSLMCCRCTQDEERYNWRPVADRREPTRAPRE